MDARLKSVKIQVACDVNNPLTGPNGASVIYGPQKGADENQVKELDENLKHFSKIVEQTLNIDIDSVPGTGAAGGIGGALYGIFGAELERGGDLVARWLALDDQIKDADLVITGEGGMNHQTVFGKTPVIVSRIAKKNAIPVIAIVGSFSEGIEPVYDEGIDAVFSVISELDELENVLKKGAKNVETTAYHIAKVLNIHL